VTAAWLWGRSELRARWRSWVILGVLAGATFGLAAAGFAGARRTSVALPRYREVTHFPTAALLANDPSFDAAKQREVAELPEVQRVYPFLIAITLVDKPINDGGGLIPTTDASAQLFALPLVEGRRTNPARADEVVVDQNLQRKFELDLGATITLGQSIPEEAITSIPPGMLAHAVDPNFEQKLTVVGISKSVNDDPSWAPSAGFYAKYGHRLAGFVNEFTALRRGTADLPRFQRDVERIIGHPVNVESFEQLLGIPKIRNLLRVEQDGLLLFALAALLLGGVLIGQALARAVGASAAELSTWRAIGADLGMSMCALVAPAVLTAIVGVATTGAVAIALSARFPISHQARRFDLHLGYHADWLVLGLAALAVVVAVMAVAILSALWAISGRRSADRSPSWAGKWATRLGLPPALAIGSRLAVEPGRGRRAVPVRSALVGAVVGVVGVVGCFTFRAGLTDTVARPQRSGIVWDFKIGSGEGPIAPKDIATITRDHDVKGALHATWYRAVRVNGVATPTWGTDTVKGATTPVVLRGRAPTARDEIALGPATAKSLKLHIGDRVTVGDAGASRATVVGTALVPSSSHTDYDQGGWMTDAGLRATLTAEQLNPNEHEDYMLVRWAPGANVKAAEHRYASLHEGGDSWYTSPATLPTQVKSLGELRSLPLALGVFFALLASATVAHALVTTVRRRRQELAVLRSIGFTRRQARIAIGWQATLIALFGLIVGIPVGIATGRLVWRRLADSFPVVYVSPLALVAVVLIVPVAIVVANLLAAVPARSAARIRPAEALRVE
jgi:hypothetical protein